MFVRDQRHCKSGRRQRTLSKASVDLVACQAIPLVLAEPLERRLLLSGGTFTVTNLSDYGAGSLSLAILDADNAGGTDIINFSGVSGTILQTNQSLPALSSNITINGPGASLLTVNLYDLGSFDIDAGVTCQIGGLTIHAGAGTAFDGRDDGGGIFNSGTLTVTNSTISDSSAFSGGGIYNSGTLNLNNSTISGDSAHTNGTGNCLGGGVYNSASGTCTVSNSTVSGNSSSGDGGGIFNRGIFTVANSTVSGNFASSGGGIENYGTLAVNDSTISGNDSSKLGGGIRTVGVGVGPAAFSVSNSTISGNLSASAGGIDIEGNGPTNIIVNSTISGNSAVTYGGGIGLFGTRAYLYDCTISGNSALSGGGFYSGASAPLGASRSTLDGSIIAANEGGDILLNAGPSSSIVGSHDLVGDGADGSILSNSLIGTAANPINPMLSALGSFGGPTQTTELLPGSPAIGQGASFTVRNGNQNEIITTDQRGVARPQGSDFDIGAFQTFVSDVSPSFTSANNAAFIAGLPGTFAIDTTGFPAASLSEAGALPAGLTFTDNGNGIGTISGTPALSDMGSYQLTLTASSGGTPDATQAFVLTVNQPIFVTTLADGVSGDLRNAISFADFLGGGVIEFASGLTGTINPTSQLPALSSGNITIEGPGANLLTVNGGGFGSVFTIDSGVAAAISGLNITGGTGTVIPVPSGKQIDSGGGILNLGSLTVANCTISGNSLSASIAYGGGIFSTGVTLSVTNSTVSGNIASEGGGIWTSAGIITTITNSTISGNTAHTGAGIYSKGALTLTSCTVDANMGIGGLGSGAGGGGISSDAFAHIVNCTISGNSTGKAGGAIFSTLGGLNIQNTTISGNTAISGGGIYTLAGGLTIANSAISGNDAGYMNPAIENMNGGGGGVYIHAGGSATVTNSTITGNSAAFGGGVSNNGLATFTSCTISDNSAAPGNSHQSNGGGGGIASFNTLTLINSTVSGNSASGDNSSGLKNGEGGGIEDSRYVSITDSTISGNSAYTGGGIYGTSTITVTNTTVSGNSATKVGGIYDVGTVTVTDTTISGNTGATVGGLYFKGFETVLTLDGSIVAANSGTDIGHGTTTTIAGSKDLIGDGSDGGILTNSLRGTAASPLNPMLSPLGNYGGPTQTMALLPGSPALGTGAFFDGLTTDQRGFARPTTFGIDIGADQGALFAGDTNFDGTVNLTDLLTLLNNYGETGKDWMQGDFNFDGVVNLTDLLALLNNYGLSADDTSVATQAAAVVSYAVKSTPFATEPLALNSAGSLIVGGASSDDADSEILLAGSGAIL